MASLALGIAGSMIGGSIGVAGATFLGMSYASIGWMAGSFIGSTLFAPSGPDTQGPRLGDLSVISSARGAPIPKVYGRSRIAGNIIWSSGINETTNTQEVGGKGGSSQTSTTYTYDASFAIGLCEGPIVGIGKIWADGRLIYNNSSLSTFDESFVSEELDITVYTGSETQAVDPLIEADKGVGNISANRGLAYIVFDQLQLAKYGNRIPNLTFEVVASGHYTDLELVNQYDMTTGNGNYQAGVYYDEDTGLIHGVEQVSYGPGGSTGGSLGEMEEFTITLDGIKTITNTYTWDYGYYTFQTNDNIARGRSDDGGYVSMYAYDQPGADPVLWYYTYIHPGTNGTATYFHEPVHAYTCPEWTRSGDYLWWWDTLNAQDTYLYRVYIPAGTSPSTAPTGTRLTNPTDIDDNYGIRSLCSDDTYLYILYTHEPTNIRRISRYLHGSLTLDSTIDVSQDAFGINVIDGDIYYAVFNTSFIYKHASFSSSVTSIVTDFNTTYTYSGLVNIWAIDAEDKVFSIWYSNYGTAGPATYDYLRSSLAYDSANVADIIEDICNDASIPTTDLTISSITDLVTGYVRTHPMTARTALEPLLTAYHTYATEIDYLLKFYKKDGIVNETILEDQLAATTNEVPDKITITRIEDLQMPRRLEITYTDQDGDYQPGNQFAQRIIT